MEKIVNNSEELCKYLKKMIIESGNDPADWVMERVIHNSLAPLEITDDMLKASADEGIATFQTSENQFNTSSLIAQHIGGCPAR